MPNNGRYRATSVSILEHTGRVSCRILEIMARYDETGFFDSRGSETMLGPLEAEIQRCLLDFAREHDTLRK